MATGRCPDCDSVAADAPGDRVSEHQVGGPGTARCSGSGKTAK